MKGVLNEGLSGADGRLEAKVATGESQPLTNGLEGERDGMIEIATGRCQMRVLCKFLDGCDRFNTSHVAS